MASSPEVPEALAQLDQAIAAISRKVRPVLAAALRLDDPERRAQQVKVIVQFLNSYAPGLRQKVGLAEYLLERLGPVPPPASDPETVERVAIWLYEHRQNRHQPEDELDWCNLPNVAQLEWVRHATELLALLNTTDDREADRGP